MSEPGRDFYFPQEPLAADHRGQLGTQDLQRDPAVVLDVLGEIDRSHPARAELTLDPVAVGERGGQPAL